MSYILDALKRAEQQRGGPTRVGTPVTRPVVFSDAARWWPWIAAAFGGLGLVVGAIALWPASSPTPPVASPAPTSAPAAASDPGVTSAPVVASAPIVTPVPVVAPPPAPIVHPPARAAESRPPAAPERRAVAKASPPAPAVERSVTSHPFPPPVPDRSPATRVIPSPVTRPASRPQEPATPPAPAEVARAAPPATPTGNAKALAARISLQVLSWAPEPKDRFVFLNGRKYGEGQTIDGMLIEHITEDGVTLSFQGERVTLKNP
jgi:hypothetical protein